MNIHSFLTAPLYENSSVGWASVPARNRRPGTAAPPTPVFVVFVVFVVGRAPRTIDLPTGGQCPPYTARRFSGFMGAPKAYKHLPGKVIENVAGTGVSPVNDDEGAQCAPYTSGGTPALPG